MESVSWIYICLGGWVGKTSFQRIELLVEKTTHPDLFSSLPHWCGDNAPNIRSTYYLLMAKKIPNICSTYS